MVHPARWLLTGECIVGVLGHPPGAGLPPGLHRVPGMGLVVGARYDRSPVGPYLELAVGQPARVGRRVGMCVTTMVVTTAESRRAGRVRWGMPKEVGALEWSADGEARFLHWVDRDVVVRGLPVGLRIPIVVPVPVVQRRSDGPVSTTARLRGVARLAGVHVDVPAGDPLAWLGGRHPGATVAGARLVMGEAAPGAGGGADSLAPGRALRPAPRPALAWAPHPGD